MIPSLQKTLDDANSYESLIEVFGLGYVGFPLAVRLASMGMNVRGVDVDENRVGRLNNNELLETERNLKGSFLSAKTSGRLHITTEPIPSEATKIGIICVPTPIPAKSIKSNIHVNSSIKGFLNTCNMGDIIIIESSVEVGTTDGARTMIEAAGYRVGKNFGLAFCPERIDPQNTKWTLENIPRVVYCSDDTTFKIIKIIYSNVNNSNLIRVSSAKTAEVTKSFENAFRLVNISLVNELAILCDYLQINAREVIDAAATKPFGFMPFYPGAGAGGHCIPKDPRFLLESSKKFGSQFTTIHNALEINSYVPTYISEHVDDIISKHSLAKSVLVCGMSYKPNIEDMRDSPGFKIVDKFIDKKYHVGVYDPFFNNELLGKYLYENNMKNKKFDIIHDMNANLKFSCLCITQHHSHLVSLLQEIYSKGVFPLVYDCQNKLHRNKNSASMLQCLGDA